MTLLLSIALIALHAVALYGWGRAFARVARLPELPPPLMAAVGLAAVIVFGGVLNLAGLVSRPALWAVVALGVVCAWPRRNLLRAEREPVQPATMVSLLGAGFVLLWITGALVPALTFNYHDDFQKYFAHPARMLQTGRVGGSALSAIGFESLGAQAFLHTFVLNLGDFAALNAVDLGLGWPLCILLAGLVPRPVPVSARVVAVLAALLINPQIVNISSTFTGSALCMAVLSLHLHANTEDSAQPRYAWTVGLLFAALCALKSSFVLLNVALLAAHGCAIWLDTRSPMRALRWMLVCAAASGLFLVPWLLVHVSSYVAALTAAPALPPPAPFEPYSVDPFSNETSEAQGYGDGFAPYTVAALVCLSLGVFGVFAASERSKRALLGLTVAIGLLAVYVIMLYVVGPAAQGSTTSLRLFVPMLIGLMPGLLLLACDVARVRSARARLLPVLLVGGALLPFAIGFPGRVVQALQQGSLLGFRELAAKPWYVEYNQYVLHGKMRQQVATAQAAVPVGVPVLAWINAPFWLDYARNPIHDLDLAGLETPWAAVPATAYVMWEYNGVATPQMRGYELESQEPATLQARIGAAGMRMAYAMIDLARHSTIVYDDHQIMVLRLAKASALQERYRGR